MPQNKPNIDELETLLGYRFKDKDLLREALTHASARSAQGGQDNERLEFLGDRVLGLGVAKLLYELFPEAREVELARHFNALVCERTCANVAQSLGLAPHLIMAASEARSGGRKKPVILADACEALLGAAAIDGGTEAALEAVYRLWMPLASKGEPPAPDAKTALQEYAQSQKRGLPEYSEISRTGADHAPSFTVEVRVKGLRPATGEGTSLKRAQQAAAEALLRRESVWNREPEIA